MITGIGINVLMQMKIGLLFLDKEQKHLPSRPRKKALKFKQLFMITIMKFMQNLSQ